jgi:hypothetical protein
MDCGVKREYNFFYHFLSVIAPAIAAGVASRRSLAAKRRVAPPPRGIYDVATQSTLNHICKQPMRLLRRAKCALLATPPKAGGAMTEE